MGFRSNEKFEKDCFVLSLEFILRIIAFIFIFSLLTKRSKKFRKVKTAQYPSLDTSTGVKDAKHFPSLSDILELGVNIPGITHKLGYNILFRDQGISWYPDIPRGGVREPCILVSWYPDIPLGGVREPCILVSWYPDISRDGVLEPCILVSWYPDIPRDGVREPCILVSWYPDIPRDGVREPCILVSWYPDIPLDGVCPGTLYPGILVS